MNKRVAYEVDVGSNGGIGSVSVDDNATDNDIRLAILNDLYKVSYEVAECDKKYAIISISSEKDGLVNGSFLQSFTGTLKEAVQWARKTETALNNRIKTAVIEDGVYTYQQNVYNAKRLDAEKED